MDQDKIAKKIKDIILSDKIFNILLKKYNISKNDVVNHLNIKFGDLKDRFAEGNGNEIVIDKSLLNKDFFDEHFHFVIHEFFHWIKRRSEHNFYFSDDEEVQSFTLAIMWQIYQKKSKEDIYKKMFPIIQSHFKKQKNAEQLFNFMYNKAKDIMSEIYSYEKKIASKIKNIIKTAQNVNDAGNIVFGALAEMKNNDAYDAAGIVDQLNQYNTSQMDEAVNYAKDMMLKVYGGIAFNNAQQNFITMIENPGIQNKKEPGPENSNVEDKNNPEKNNPNYDKESAQTDHPNQILPPWSEALSNNIE